MCPLSAALVGSVSGPDTGHEPDRYSVQRGSDTRLDIPGNVDVLDCASCVFRDANRSRPLQDAGTKNDA